MVGRCGLVVSGQNGGCGFHVVKEEGGEGGRLAVLGGGVAEAAQGGDREGGIERREQQASDLVGRGRSAFMFKQHVAKLGRDDLELSQRRDSRRIVDVVRRVSRDPKSVPGTGSGYEAQRTLPLPA